MINLDYTLKEELPGIYRLHFASRYQLAMHFLRLQEYYESPKYHKEIFTLVDYMDWYASEHKEVFSYPTDWSGFNVPGKVLSEVYIVYIDSIEDYNKYDTFMSNIYNHIMSNERAKHVGLQREPKFYLIGTSDAGYKGDGDCDAVLNHEFAHAFWYMDDVYRMKASNEINNIDGGRYDAAMEALQEMGYHESTCRDEIHAYCATGLCKALRNPLSRVNKKSFESLFNEKLKEATREMHND